MIKLTWLSHASWLIETNSHRILLDPFFADNPKATVSAEDFSDVSHVLVSHGHADHMADAAGVIKASGAALVTNFEIAQWFQQQHGVSDATGMNLGGQVELPFGKVRMVPALHSSSLPDGTYAGTAAGFLLTLGGRRVYFACDTAYFSDMKWYAAGVDIAVVPIGDLFTMGVHDSVEAIKVIQPKHVLPAHYDTWPPIEQDATAWADKVTSETDAKPVVLAVGESFQL
ncbi:metal-dependent hydrolase [Roseiconus nitratireducens]|uniref:UPF0173 metal-dependent hydrolase FYK55_08515 n=1 Tax=Roseiconus nitratireducens TaxID=2605748 RepID=A0A5M6DE13_9BACT|nr:metal-dependent hydrolase [Roseiconus nitratireducens]KAA5544379.1 metal-dependent hydrolase [Roseiconus nitratireducens]